MFLVVPIFMIILTTLPLKDYLKFINSTFFSRSCVYKYNYFKNKKMTLTNPDIVVMDISGKEILIRRRIFEREPQSLLYQIIQQTGSETILIDRDFSMMTLIINALRHPQLKILVPDNFDNWQRQKLIEETLYWKLANITCEFQKNTSNTINTIIISHHATLTFGKQGISCDVNFRKISRILISGKVILCREIFGETLNETRDGGGMGEDRYTSRFFLKHTFLEQAFDSLASKGFKLISSSTMTPHGTSDARYDDDQRFMHYSQFVFQKKDK
uniref:BTB_2 domain-containing protein n=1 Tax=Rhabditophanes sp. KR3021 TaxID=114890 RepID=A0AC35TME9_9BILA